MSDHTAGGKGESKRREEAFHTFMSAFDAGAPCGELIALKIELQPFLSADDEQVLSQRLREVGCYSPTSERQRG